VDLFQRDQAASCELTVAYIRTGSFNFILELRTEAAMSNPYTQSDYRDALRTDHSEPLLPIEKKLIAWSLGIGLALLVVLALVNHFYPPGT
jgi:hypothetical protein